jgi:hypothetical protein
MITLQASHQFQSHNSRLPLSSLSPTRTRLSLFSPFRLHPSTILKVL